MSYEEALRDLKDQFGPKKLLDTQDVAEALGRSREAMAMLRLRKQFPIARKHGRRVVVSIYDLAKFISGDDASNAAADTTPTPKAVKATPGRSNRRPASLAKALVGFRHAIDQQQIQIEFQNGVYACLEAIEIASTTEK